MKHLFSILSATILFGTFAPAPAVAVEVSVDFFHDSLDSYGDWREVGDYGYCWQPREVDRDWRPYNDGRWLYTDAGWTWDSEEPYSWAVYHYGRWANVERVGWVWVPGTEWGPAWVSWRHSADHVGWAPLPPEARFSRSTGFSGRVDADFDIGPSNYSFVTVRNFGAPRLRTVIVAPRDNITIIRQTTNITRITYVNNVVYNEGPQYDTISRQSEQPIRRMKLDRREDFGGDPRSVRPEQLRTRVDGDSYRVLAPSFDASPATAPRKVAARVDKPNVDRGWKNAGSPAEVTKLRTKIKSEPAAPANLPSNPREEAPAVSGVPAPQPAAPNTKEPAAPGEKPVVLEQRAKPSKAPKGVKPAAVPRVPEPTAERSEPSKQPPANEPAASAEKPVVPEQRARPGKAAKGVKPAAAPRVPEPAAERAEPSKQPPSPREKGRDDSRVPAEVAPPQDAPARMPKNTAPAHKLPPAQAEPARKQIQEAPPKPREAEAPRSERHAPEKPDARPQARQPEPRPQGRQPEPRKQAAPAAVQPQPPQPAKGKGKGKDADEKKDADSKRE
jgi:hypothetical protein